METELLEEDDRNLQPEKDLNSDVGLAAIVDRVLDKGLVINADIIVTVGDAELLGIKIRAALASFETAAQFGLQFPAGTNTETAAWKNAIVEKENCPQCLKNVEITQLLEKDCPWCGWVSAKAKKLQKIKPILQIV
jgi:ssDNA-binding Zn-finger/Zn-ribbon topoisomerase 1